MIHHQRQLLLIGMLLFAAVRGNSQEQSKVEYEVRIDAEAAPESALAFISACPFEKNVRWYEEHGFETVSYEAKTRSNGRKYSIEFDSTGRIEDVEYEIDFEDIPAETRSLLHNALCTQFKKYVVIKTQVQWTGSPDMLLAQLQSQPGETPVTRYEIVLKGITDDDRRLYEVLFDPSGLMLQKSVIVPRNTDHLDY